MPEFFTAALTDLLSQGDVFDSGWDDDLPDPVGPLIVLSHDCEVDKSQSLLVASLVLANDTPPSLLGHIKVGRVFHAFYLHGVTDAWVNFRTTHPINKSVLLAGLHRRRASMTSDGKDSLAAKYFSFLTRSLPPEAPIAS